MSGVSSHARRPGPGAMSFGLAGAGVAWFLQTGFGEALVAQVCYRHDMALPVPRWLMGSVGGVAFLALLAGVAGIWVAARNWRRTRKACADSPLAPDARDERRHFLATAGLLFSALFLIGLVAAWLAVLLVSPCSAWR